MLEHPLPEVVQQPWFRGGSIRCPPLKDPLFSQAPKQEPKMSWDRFVFTSVAPETGARGKVVEEGLNHSLIEVAGLQFLICAPESKMRGRGEVSADGGGCITLGLKLVDKTVDERRQDTASEPL